MKPGLKYIEEFRAGEKTAAMLRKLQGTISRPWTIMEVCGGQTHALIRHGIDRALAGQIEIVHGPGCPVCIVPAEKRSAVSFNPTTAIPSGMISMILVMISRIFFFLTFATIPSRFMSIQLLHDQRQIQHAALS